MRNPCVYVGSFNGVALARIGSKAVAATAEALDTNILTVRNSLDNIVNKVGQLAEEKETIPTYDMSTEIDRLVLDDLNDFVEARQAISHIYGLQSYADVMSHYAGGERYLNRVWSASADGYVNEVKDYISHSLEQFTIARDKLVALADAPTDSDLG